MRYEPIFSTSTILKHIFSSAIFFFLRPNELDGVTLAVIWWQPYDFITHWQCNLIQLIFFFCGIIFLTRSVNYAKMSSGENWTPISWSHFWTLIFFFSLLWVFVNKNRVVWRIVHDNDTWPLQIVDHLYEPVFKYNKVLLRVIVFRWTRFTQ
jgi:hypothetical protein